MNEQVNGPVQAADALCPTCHGPLEEKDRAYTRRVPDQAALPGKPAYRDVPMTFKVLTCPAGECPLYLIQPGTELAPLEITHSATPRDDLHGPAHLQFDTGSGRLNKHGATTTMVDWRSIVFSKRWPVIELSQA